MTRNSRPAVLLTFIAGMCLSTPSFSEEKLRIFSTDGEVSLEALSEKPDPSTAPDPNSPEGRRRVSRDPFHVKPTIEDKRKRWTAIERYDTGVWVRIYEPNDINWLGRMDQANTAVDLQRVDEVISRHVNDGRNYRIQEGDVKSSQSGATDKRASFRVRQRIAGMPTGDLEISSRRLSEDDVSIKIAGILVNPDIPQLDPDNWMSEKEALGLAIAALQPHVAGTYFARRVKEGRITGERSIQTHRQSNQLTVRVVYRVKGPQVIATVDLNTREVSVDKLRIRTL